MNESSLTATIIKRLVSNRHLPFMMSGIVSIAIAVVGLVYHAYSLDPSRANDPAYLAWRKQIVWTHLSIGCLIGLVFWLTSLLIIFKMSPQNSERTETARDYWTGSLVIIAVVAVLLMLGRKLTVVSDVLFHAPAAPPVSACDSGHRYNPVLKVCQLPDDIAQYDPNETPVPAN